MLARLKTLFATAALSVFAASAGMVSAAAAGDVQLSGIIRDAHGPITGAAVWARPEGSTISTSVFTDANGAYYFPDMAPGKYVVWAQAQGYQLNKGDGALSGIAHKDFTLSPLADATTQMTGGDFLASLPEATPDDKRLKLVIRNACTGCHPPNFPLQHKFDEAGWNAILNQMKTFGGPGQVFQTIDFHQKELAAYLARARGPGQSSMTIKVAPPPTGDAARVVVKEYDIPFDPSQHLDMHYGTNDGTNWALGPASGGFGMKGIHDVEADLDGNMWFTYNQHSQYVTVGRIDAKTGQVRFFRLDGVGDIAASSHGISRDKDGILWFNATVSRTVAWLGRIDPKTLEVTAVKQPKNIPPYGGTMAVDGPGKVWGSVVETPGNTGLIRYDQSSRTFNAYKTPNDVVTYGVLGDRDGNGWGLQMRADNVFKVDVKSGKVRVIHLQPIKEWLATITPQEWAFYPTMPTNNDVAYPGLQGPRRGAADLNADLVWVCDFWGGNLARIDTHTLNVSYVPMPDPMSQQPYALRVDSHHNVWVAMMNTDKLMKYDPSAKTWTAYNIPTRGSETRQLSLLERGGRLEVFLPYERVRKVAVMTFRTEDEMQALKKTADSQKQASNN